MSVPKDKNPPRRVGLTYKQKRNKEKLTRLDNLIPKGNVTGDRQLLFGATEHLTTDSKKDKE